VFLLVVGGIFHVPSPLPALADGWLSLPTSLFEFNEHDPGEASFLAGCPICASLPYGQSIQVAVAASSGDITVSPPILVFDLYNQSREVTVTYALTEYVAGDSHQTAVTFTYNGQVETLPVNVLDDDLAGVRIDPSPVTITEGGSSSFSVQLASQPVQTATINISLPAGLSPAPGQAGNLYFNGDSWDVPQTVFFQAPDDSGEVTGTRVVTIDFALSGYPEYLGSPVSLEADILDNDRGVIITEDTGDKDSLQVGENGSAGYDLKLSAPVAAGASVYVNAGLPAGLNTGDVGDGVFVFDESNWAAPQTFTFFADGNGDQDGDRTVSITNTIDGANTSDPDYLGVPVRAVSATIIDDDGGNDVGQTHYVWRGATGGYGAADSAGSVPLGTVKRVRFRVEADAIPVNLAVGSNLDLGGFSGNEIGAAVIDNENGYAYFGTNASSGKVTRVALSGFPAGKTELYLPPFTVGSAVFSGTGLDDLSRGGSFTGDTPKSYCVEIDAVGDFDSFKWSDNGCTPEVWNATGVTVTGSAQALNDGLTVTLGSTNSHTVGDRWTFDVTSPANLVSAVIDTASAPHYAYFGTDDGHLYRLDLGNFTASGITLLDGSAGVSLTSAVIDTASAPHYAYFGTSSGLVYRVDLSTFASTDVVSVDTGAAASLISAVIDPAAGAVYFGTDGGYIYGADLVNFDADHVGSLDTGAGLPLIGASIDPAAGFAYFVANSDSYLVPSKVIKVSLGDYSVSGSLDLPNDHYLGSVVSAGGLAHLFYSSDGSLGAVTVNLDSLRRLSSISLGTLSSPRAVINTAGDRVYVSGMDSAADYGIFVREIQVNSSADLVFGLEYAPKVISCQAAENWMQVPVGGSDNAWQLADDAALDGSTTDDNYGPSSSLTFVPGYVVSTTNSAPNISLGINRRTEVEFAVKTGPAQVLPGQSYCFRLTNDGGLAGLRFDKYAAATAVMAGEEIWRSFAPSAHSAPPIISVIFVSSPTPDSAVISWATDEPATSRVRYGETTAYGREFLAWEYLLIHSASLTGLTAGATYHYQACSTDTPGNQACTEDRTFTASILPDKTPPAISNVLAGKIGETSAAIFWTTDELADSAVEYGPTTAYGLTSGGPAVILPAVAHAVELTGLKPDTSYHFRVLSRDAAGNEAVSQDQVFTTGKSPDTTPPKIAGVSAGNIIETSAVIFWTTDELADSAVEYGPTRDLGSVVSSAIPAVSHFVTITGLEQGAEYFYRVVSRDAAGNEAASGAQTFTAKGRPDTMPPALADISVAGITDRSAIIRWTTDESASSVVEYGQTADHGLTARGAGGVRSHRVTLSGLEQETGYHYRVVSRDAAGNEAVSADLTFVTVKYEGPPLVCSDSDGGVVPEKLGVVAFNNERFQDACLDAASVVEHYCDNEAEASMVMDCGAGKKCFAGACVDENYDPLQAVCGNGICDEGESYLNCAQDCPSEPTEIPPEAVGPLVPEDQRLDTNDINLFSTSGRSGLEGGGGGGVNVYPSMSLTVYLPDGSIQKPIDGAYVTFGGFTYPMQPTASYEAKVATPTAPGNYELSILINYQDKTHDIVNFPIKVVSAGSVYEEVNGGRQPVVGARVTLYVDTGGGNLGLWDGGPSGQLNPQQTNGKGAYTFVVPPGSYRLVAEKEGYRTKETLAFPVGAENIINKDLLLIKAPETFIDEISQALAAGNLADQASGVAGAVGKQAAYAAKAAVEDAKEFVQNPYVKQETERTVAPAATVVAVANVASYGAATATGFPYLIYLYTLLSHPLMLIARRKRRKWGVVFNSLTRLPVDLAIIRLIDAKTGRILRTAATGSDGRYVFLVQPGQYKLSVSRPGHVFPSALLRGQTEAVAYVDLYHGEPVNISSETAVTPNIPVDPLAAEKTPRQIIFAGIARRLQVGLGIASIVIMAGAALITPRPAVIALLAANIAVFFAFRRLSVARRPKSWGVVYDEKTKKPLRNALARIFESRFNRLLETQITDSKGHYAFLVGRNTYNVSFEKPGYQKLQKGPIDLTRQEKTPEAGVVELDIGLSPGAGPAPTAPAPRPPVQG